jgi:hypothetical protein
LTAADGEQIGFPFQENVMADELLGYTATKE